MDRCPHCMIPLESAGQYCPHCGGKLSYTAPEQHLPMGTMLMGSRASFQIGAARGQGGFGITYAGLELGTGRRAAIKEYFPSRCAQRGADRVQVSPKPGQEGLYQGGLQSFLEETRMLMAVEKLPCVVHIWDFFQANGTAYLVMEYLDGTSLHQKMTKEGNLPAQELLFRLQPLLGDLEVLHQARILHRDISPDNIIWTEDGTLKLIDFGCARSMEDGKSMTVLLKHGFAPVEQYQTRGQGPWTDVYAMAATIYYCITGKVPPSAVERLEDETLASPRSLGVDLDAEQERALLWGLTVQPKSRPESMGAFSRQLYAVPPRFHLEAPAAPVTTGGAAGPVTGGIPTGGATGPVTGGTTMGGTTGPVIGGTTMGSTTGPVIGGTTMGSTTGPVTGDSSVGATTMGGATAGGAAGPASGGGSPQFKPGLSKRTIGILAGAAAGVVALIIILAVALGGGSKPSPAPRNSSPITAGEPSAAPTQSGAPGPEASAPSPLEGVTGVTDDGYTYRILGEKATLTGYNGTSSSLSMPDEVDDVKITAIADDAFAGMSGLKTVLLPIYLEEIGSGAFRDCSSLWSISCYSSVECADDAFDGCSSLRYVRLSEGDALNGSLPKNCRVLLRDLNLGVGVLDTVELGEHGVLYATVEDYDGKVLLDVPSGLSGFTVPEGVTWVYEHALDGADSGVAIQMSSGLVFPFELYYEADWSLPDSSLGDNVPIGFNWLLACSIADRINNARPSGAGELAPDLAFVKAAMVRAQELEQSYGGDRPDGSSWSTALDEQGASWRHALSRRFKLDLDDDDFSDTVDEIVSDYTGIREEYGTYANYIGVAAWAGSDGYTYMQVLLNYPDAD